MDKWGGGNGGGGTGCVVDSVIGGLFGGFGGHQALGGDVQAGMSYDVGEMGGETFVPTTNGKIIPNKSPGGGNAYSRLLHVARVQRKSIREYAARSSRFTELPSTRR